MSVASATGQIVYLQNGGTISAYPMANIGDLYQNYGGTSDAPTDIYPDFTQVQPILSMVYSSSKQATGIINPNNIDWKFNGTALTFGANGLSTNTFGGETGHFKKVVPEAGKNDYYGLQIVKNLVKASGAAPCKIEASATFVQGAGSQTINTVVNIPITQRIGDSNIVNIRAADTNFFSIREKGGSCKLKAVAVRGNSEVTSGLGYQWRQLNGDGTWKTLAETGSTLTVTEAMVDTAAIFQCIVTQNGTTFGKDEATVVDLSDPYAILPNPTPADETITDDDASRTTVVYHPKLVKRGETAEVNAQMKFFMVFTDAAGNILNTASASTAAREFTATLAMCKQAGNAGPTYLITTES